MLHNYLSPQASLSLRIAKLKATAKPKPLPRIELPGLRGANDAAFNSDAPELVISGPAGTGKTRTWLTKLHWLASNFKRCRLLILRKTRESLTESALVTFERDVLGEDHPLLVSTVQRENRRRYTYPNGSEIVVAGLTQSNKDQRAKVMSTDYDLIYVPECTELSRDEWEKLGTRLRDGVLPYRQLGGDANPDSPMHWLWSRQISGLTQMLWGRHEDNPKLYDGENWTSAGTEYLERLQRLTGHMRERLLWGKWVQASGLVLDTYDDQQSVTIDAEYVPNAGPVMWFLDDGYSAGSAMGTRGIDANTGMFVADAHPRVFLLAQVKPDGHLDVFAEDYRCLTLTDIHIEAIIALSNEKGWPMPDFASHGHGTAEIRGRLYAANIYPRQNTGTVDETVKVTRSALGADANGWRRIRIHPRCKHLRGEMLTWAYDPATEKPYKHNDHGPESLRGGIFVMRNMS